MDEGAGDGGSCGKCEGSHHDQPLPVLVTLSEALSSQHWGYQGIKCATSVFPKESCDVSVSFTKEHLGPTWSQKLDFWGQVFLFSQLLLILLCLSRRRDAPWWLFLMKPVWAGKGTQVAGFPSCCPGDGGWWSQGNKLPCWSRWKSSGADGTISLLITFIAFRMGEKWVLQGLEQSQADKQVLDSLRHLGWCHSLGRRDVGWHNTKGWDKMSCSWCPLCLKAGFFWRTTRTAVSWGGWGVLGVTPTKDLKERLTG